MKSKSLPNKTVDKPVNIVYNGHKIQTLKK